MNNTRTYPEIVLWLVWCSNWFISLRCFTEMSNNNQHKYVHTRMHSSRMCTTRSSSCWGRFASVHAGIHPPGCGPGDLPWVGAWRPPLARPLNFPPGFGPGNLQGMLGYHPLLQGMLGYHLQCMLGYNSLWTEFLTHATENITLPQTSFWGGN